MRELSLHLLDIAENSAAANATCVTVLVEEDTGDDRLRMVVEDNGKGMSEAQAKAALTPYFTSRTTRKVGLGIPLLKEAAEACNGYLTLESQPGKGTRLEVVFQRSHIDRMPLGDLAGTFLTLLVGFPAVNWLLKYRMDDRNFEVDALQIKQEIGEIPITEPGILSFVKEYLKSGIEGVQTSAA